jgi:hypothetical protein
MVSKKQTTVSVLHEAAKDLAEDRLDEWGQEMVRRILAVSQYRRDSAKAPFSIEGAFQLYLAYRAIQRMPNHLRLSVAESVRPLVVDNERYPHEAFRGRHRYIQPDLLIWEPHGQQRRAQQVGQRKVSNSVTGHLAFAAPMQLVMLPCIPASLLPCSLATLQHDFKVSGRQGFRGFS